MSGKSQQESEAPAKVYQIDALAEQLINIEKLIKSQNTIYVNKDSLALDLQKRDSRIEVLETKDKNRNKVFWLLGASVIALAANTLWQFIINSGRLQ